MKRLPIIRHIRWFYHRYRCGKQALLWDEFGGGLGLLTPSSTPPWTLSGEERHSL